MNLPENYSFNQQNLQDFLDCHRLFYLRHILKQEWPALESEPVLENEELMKMGELFHRYVQQQGAGVPDGLIEDSINDPILESWWQQFVRLDIRLIEGQKFYERMYSVPFMEYRLVAKYDLVILALNKQVIIYDWKTSQKTPERKWLQNRMQTRVYPLVMSLASTSQNLFPEAIEMIYWYPAFPKATVHFTYSKEKFDEDKDFITTIIREIEALDSTQFEKTEHQTRCRFCRYRSLCERGDKAGDWRGQDELEINEASAFDIDFEQISAAD